jgi:hypothetical protein
MNQLLEKVEKKSNTKWSIFYLLNYNNLSFTILHIYINELTSRKPEMGVFCSLFTKQIIMTSYMKSLLKKYENYTVSPVIHRLPRD